MRGTGRADAQAAAFQEAAEGHAMTTKLSSIGRDLYDQLTARPLLVIDTEFCTQQQEHHLISLPPEVETALKSLAPLLQQSGSLYVPPPMLELQEAEIVDSPDPAE